jgi:hypothetical protein
MECEVDLDSEYEARVREYDTVKDSCCETELRVLETVADELPVAVRVGESRVSDGVKEGVAMERVGDNETVADLNIDGVSPVSDKLSGLRVWSDERDAEIVARDNDSDNDFVTEAE